MLIKRLEKSDWFLISLSIVGSCVFGYAIWDESWVLRHFIVERVGSQVIGKITTSSNDVRRRLSRSITWHDAGHSEALYEKDSIFTGEMSEADILLVNKQSFHLSSNSMVIIRSDGGEVSLDLKIGSLTGKSSGDAPLRIIQNGNITKVYSKPHGKPIYFTKNKQGDIDLHSEANEIEVHVNDQIEKASGNKVIRIKNRQEIKNEIEIEKEIAPAQLASSEPVVPKATSREELLKMDVLEAPEKLILSEPKKIVTLNLKRGLNSRRLASVYDGLAHKPKFKWESKITAQFFQVELSTRPDFFESLVLDADDENLSAMWLEPKPGDYYYRVVAYGTKEGNLASQTGRLRVRLPKVALQPSYNEVIDIEDPADLDLVEKSFEFNWQSHPLADEYRLSVFDKSGNKKFEKKLSQSHFLYKPNEPGNFIIEVLPLINGEAVGPKDEVSLNYEKNLLTRTPATILPMAGATLVVFGSVKNSSPVLFEWNPVAYAKDYDLEISNDPDFKTMLHKKIVKKSNLVIKELGGSNKLYWRVRARYTNEIFSDWSKPEFFEKQYSR